MLFDELKFEPHPNWTGVQAKMMFDNGYGVSVIRASGEFGNGSYGHEEGLYELAVLHKDITGCCYTTPITDNVIGYLTPEKVSEIMEQVKNLPKKGE
jgi:hypothetical protein